MCFTLIASPSKVVADWCMNMVMKEVFSVVALLEMWIFWINFKSGNGLIVLVLVLPRTQPLNALVSVHPGLVHDFLGLGGF